MMDARRLVWVADGPWRSPRWCWGVIAALSAFWATAPDHIHNDGALVRLPTPPTVVYVLPVAIILICILWLNPRSRWPVALVVVLSVLLLAGVSLLIAGPRFYEPFQRLRADSLSADESAACNRGDGSACLRAASLDVPDEYKVRFYERGCALNDSESCARLGLHLIHSTDWLQTPPGEKPALISRGIALLRKACDAGHRTACGSISAMYRGEGHYVAPNEALAHEYWQKTEEH
jgi:hypothetical protein